MIFNDTDLSITNTPAKLDKDEKKEEGSQTTVYQTLDDQITGIEKKKSQSISFSPLQYHVLQKYLKQDKSEGKKKNKWTQSIKKYFKKVCLYGNIRFVWVLLP